MLAEKIIPAIVGLTPVISEVAKGVISVANSNNMKTIQSKDNDGNAVEVLSSKSKNNPVVKEDKNNGLTVIFNFNVYLPSNDGYSKVNK